MAVLPVEDRHFFERWLMAMAMADGLLPLTFDLRPLTLNVSTHQPLNPSTSQRINLSPNTPPQRINLPP